jgi:signal peptidase I
MFAPRYVKMGKIILKNGRKLLNYRRDTMDEKDCKRLTAAARDLEHALASRDRAEVEASTERLDRELARHLPPRKDALWRENCEVFLVAIVIALGVRSYFLQPFTIPTGSMQPTLNGITGVRMELPPPNIFQRIFEFATFGRTYINVVSQEQDYVLTLTEKKRFRFFTFTEIRCARRQYVVHAPRETLIRYFGIEPQVHMDPMGIPVRRSQPTRVYEAGEPIARGYVSAGDHVFVDKMSSHLRFPQRDEVFVFKTTGISGIEARHDPSLGSQFYIKRIAGLPDDTLRIDPPLLYIQGAPAQGEGMQRVMSMKDGYRGYSNAPAGGRPFNFLPTPDSTFRVPPHSYFALGDNSYHSADSRDWGSVPARNVMGRGFFVYWPFTSHWGLIE